ncbi:MAG: ATP-binding protein [Desulfobacterium sp.]|nr:ATP-binding protein [Desulfobacterium sp.]
MSHIFDHFVTEESVTVTFSSSLENIDRTCDEVGGFLKQGFKEMEEHFFAIKLVMREALTNAVRHGNRLDPGKRVNFFLEIDQARSIRMVIEDQGDGFDWQRARQRPPNEDDDHGRGLVIMTAYFSSCGYNRKGNRLILEKRLSPLI